MHIIAGTHKNQRLVSPKGSQTRPTASRLRETLFNICQNYITDSDFLDLFAGSGAIGFEALSRGAASTCLVDSSKECLRCMQINSQLFQDYEISLICSDVFVALKKFIQNGKSFDIIYADPPYDMKGYHSGDLVSYSERILEIVDGSILLRKGGHLFIEDLPKAIPESLKLSTLSFIGSRPAGRASLFHFQASKP